MAGPPGPAQWHERRRWFQARAAARGDGGRWPHGPQSLALLAELEQVFCAGAWLAAVVLAQTVIDAAMAESDRLDGETLNTLRFGRGHVWLRNRRNALLHRADTGPPAITPDERERDAARLEREARKAVTLTLKGLLGG